jgi:hypothetical protein
MVNHHCRFTLFDVYNEGWLGLSWGFANYVTGKPKQTDAQGQRRYSRAQL